MASDIGLSRKQTVFAVKESTLGTLLFPSANDYVIPAGNAVMNQNPSFSDSEELVDSLDILDQFQNATPAGEFTIPMYARPSGTIGSVPQGSALLESLMGGKSSCTASLSSALLIAGTSIEIDGITDELPERGIIQIGTEDIFYTAKTQVLGGTTATLTTTVPNRGYNSTTATGHTINDTLDLRSVYYSQKTTSESMSIWIKTDHFVQGMSGCSTNQVTVGVNNEGGVMLTCAGQGMQMVWAGKDALTSGTSATSILPVNDADRFSTGAFIYNVTTDDNNSGSGYEILSVSSGSNTISVNATTTWTSADVIQGYLPTGTKIGSVIESKDTTVTLDSVSSKFKSGDLSLGCPKQYLEDEIGTTFPEAYVENVRTIESTLGLYFRKADAKYFAEGYVGNEIPIELTFGDTDGSKMRVYMKRCKVQVPTISFTAPTVDLSIPIKALGTDGEDSCDLCFE